MRDRHCVQLPKHVAPPRVQRPKEVAPPRPRLTHLEVQAIFESIDCLDASGLRDRALISLMFHNHLRPADALGIRRSDLFRKSGKHYLRILSSRGRATELILPVFPEAEQAVTAFLATADVALALDAPLFRTVDPKTRGMTTNPLSTKAAHISINRRAARAGFKREISLHEFRVAGARLLKEQSEVGNS